MIFKTPHNVTHKSTISYKFKIFLLMLSSTFILSHLAKAAESESSKILNQPGRINLAISLQWEGESLAQTNLNAINDFRSKFESISFFQIINPAYFTKVDGNPKKSQQKIKSVMRSHDTLGLQLLGWKSLITDAGLVFRNAPTFWGNTIKDKFCLPDCGHEVPLSVYNKNEIVTLIKHSKDLFQQYELGDPQVFMAGGWMANNQVLEAAVETGFKYDFSGIPPHLIKKRIGKYPIYQWATELWGQTTAFSQPISIPTRNGSITEVFNNSATLDYISSKDIVDLYKAYANLLKKNPDESYVISVGLYQETAAKNLPKLASALQNIFAHSAKNNISVGMLNLPGTQNNASQTLSKNTAKRSPVLLEDITSDHPQAH